MFETSSLSPFFFMIDEFLDSKVALRLDILAPFFISSLFSLIYFLCDGESSLLSELLLSLKYSSSFTGDG
jgi:hypothetical protein